MKVKYESLIAPFEWIITDKYGRDLPDHLVLALTIRVGPQNLPEIELDVIHKNNKPMPNTIRIRTTSNFGTVDLCIEKISYEKLHGYKYKNRGPQAWPEEKNATT